jgi:hypothetical protein
MLFSLGLSVEGSASIRVFTTGVGLDFERNH